MLISLKPEALQDAIKRACHLETAALKPGNVSRYREGHGMTVQDFLASAEAIAVPMTAPDSSIGERIFNSVQATRDMVSLNTNLGIILLFAPVIHAALSLEPERSLKTRLERHLLVLDLMDAELAFKAICTAAPGGLGEAPRHDVKRPAEVTLLHAMKEAKSRDLVARQYANGYRDVFEVGLRRARSALTQWHNPEWVAVAVYLAFLARFPDSLIARKYGAPAAREVSVRAGELEARLNRETQPENLVPALLEWDGELKNAGLNPGTSADLTAATLLILDVQERLAKRVPGKQPVCSETWDYPHTPAIRG
ncbi:MAG TPA: triphosphoribosyl-dephospho-CoA synthase [Burkholderiales bacterium]|nr:triphosphoribosyl-dephospho-CoA synthase [Burkholderiales bacterium]